MGWDFFKCLLSREKRLFPLFSSTPGEPWFIWQYKTFFSNKVRKWRVFQQVIWREVLRGKCKRRRRKEYWGEPIRRSIRQPYGVSSALKSTPKWREQFGKSPSACQGVWACWSLLASPLLCSFWKLISKYVTEHFSKRAMIYCLRKERARPAKAIHQSPNARFCCLKPDHCPHLDLIPKELDCSLTFIWGKMIRGSDPHTLA